MALRACVIGARRRVLGTGPYVARFLSASGCELVGILGTSEASVAEAQRVLARDYGLAPKGYIELETMLRRERPDIVAICSPNAAHRAQLEACCRAGAHVLCEKPLWWPAGDPDPRALGLEARRVAEGFAASNLLLRLNAQWPQTLPAYLALQPENRGCAVKSFEMRLSPVLSGPIMLIDSASHLLSMLEALVGLGRIEAPSARWGGDEASSLLVSFSYASGRGDVDCRFRLQRCPEPPRPAWYAINGRRAERRISLPAYEMEFVDGERSVPLEDPLKLHVEDFVQSVRRGAPTEVESLVASLENLALLTRVVKQQAGECGEE
jgi:hypothetical protein